MATVKPGVLTPADLASVAAIESATASRAQIQESAQAVHAARDAMHTVEAVEDVPGGFVRPTRVAVQSRTLDLRTVQDITYVHPVTHRAWGAEAGRSEYAVEGV